MNRSDIDVDFDDRVRSRSSTTSTASEPDTNDQARSSIGSRASLVTTSAWTPTDDEVLASARAAGLNWQPIATRFFPNKTANACRKRHERLMERRHQEDWTGERLEQLAQAYFDCRKDMWAILGAKLGERWGLVESKCMEKGLKNLQTIARQSQRKRRRLNDGGDSARSEPDPEDDSGIGLSDAEIDMIVDNRPSSASSESTKRSISPDDRTHKRHRTPDIMHENEPPLSAMSDVRPSYLPPIDTAMVKPAPMMTLPQPPDPLVFHRGRISIESILSPAE